MLALLAFLIDDMEMKNINLYQHLRYTSEKRTFLTWYPMRKDFL